MTNFVEQLMKTAGVKPISERCDEGGGCIGYIYPDFTAEKQLELIKLIADKETYSDVKIEFGIWHENNLWGFEFWEDGGYTVIERANPDFTQALAQLTTERMKANELDKEKVREVLEG